MALLFVFGFFSGVRLCLVHAQWAFCSQSLSLNSVAERPPSLSLFWPLKSLFALLLEGDIRSVSLSGRCKSGSQSRRMLVVVVHRLACLSPPLTSSSWCPPHYLSECTLLLRSFFFRTIPFGCSLKSSLFLCRRFSRSTPCEGRMHVLSGIEGGYHSVALWRS